MNVTGVQTCALPIASCRPATGRAASRPRPVASAGAFGRRDRDLREALPHEARPRAGAVFPLDRRRHPRRRAPFAAKRSLIPANLDWPRWSARIERCDRAPSEGGMAMREAQGHVDVRCPVSTVYNQFTQFEEFPRFMSNVKSVRQLDHRRLHWQIEIGGVGREFAAEITEKKPDERTAWKSIEGKTH